MKTSRCPSCKSIGILVGYSSIPGDEVTETYLCLNCGGRFTVPLKGEETTAEAV